MWPFLQRQAANSQERWEPAETYSKWDWHKLADFERTKFEYIIIFIRIVFFYFFQDFISFKISFRNETLSFSKEEKDNLSCPSCFSCHGFPWPESPLQVTFHTGLTRVALQKCPVLLALLCYRSADPCKQLLCKVGFIAAATGLQSAARFYSGALLQVTHPVTQPPFALSWVW